MATDKGSSVINFHKEAAKRGRPVTNITTQAVSQSIENGSNNTQISGDNNTVNHYRAEKIVEKPKVTVQPGYEVVTEEQKVILSNLVKEIADLEIKLKKKPASHAAIWSATNSKAGATSYHRIRLEKFPIAEKFLRQWIGRLNSAKNAPKKDNDSWRKRHYAYIKVNIKQLTLEDKLVTHLSEKFGVTSLTELSDADLKSVYLSVAGWKQSRKK